MHYTVKKLAKISGVSVRALHWWDKVGLLKPTFYGENGYRYYSEKELLTLQQILFFKELDFSLSDIQKILNGEEFDKLSALQTHRKILEENIERKQQLIATIDRTIDHLRGEKMTTDQELYYGFDSQRQKEYEQYIIKYKGLESEKRFAECKRRTAKWSKNEWDDVKNQGDQLHKELATLIDQGLSPESDEVQSLMQKHFDMQNRFYELNKEVYIGLAGLYKDHPDFKKFFDAYHPRMIDFIGDAMRYYAEKNL